MIELIEISLKSGFNYIGENLGSYDNKIALKNPFKIFPLPDGSKNNVILVPLTFFSDNINNIIYVDVVDIIISNIVDNDVYKEKYFNIINKKEISNELRNNFYDL